MCEALGPIPSTAKTKPKKKKIKKPKQYSHYTIKSQKLTPIPGMGVGSVVKSIHSWEGSGFNSQYHMETAHHVLRHKTHMQCLDTHAGKAHYFTMRDSE